MRKDRLLRVILRMLLERERAGYDLYKELAMKGVEIRTNYLYMILSEMEKQGLLKGRWQENSKGPRKHFYSLAKKGEAELRGLLKEAIELLMGAFAHSNMNAENLPEHIASVRNGFRAVGVEPPGRGTRLVLTTPSFDPLVCYPISFYVASEAFPEASVSIVGSPKMMFREERANLAFWDGWRHDIPMKDGFADYLMMEGFPQEATVEETIVECVRVLKDKGHLFIRVPRMMTQENVPRIGSLAEFASKLYYDLSNQDRVVSVEEVKQFLSNYSANVRTAEAHGNIVIYAEVRKERMDLKSAKEIVKPAVELLASA